MTSSSVGPHRVVVGVGAWIMLLGAGIVLSSSWFVAFPEPVFDTAVLIAVVAMVAVAVDAFHRSRADGTGFLSAVGQSFKELGRFVLWFF